MPERKNSIVLDPYCPYCGLYKGVGDCENLSCRGEDDSREKSKSWKNRMCVRCGNSVSIMCTRCGQGFCSEHSENSRSTRIEEFSMLIGTCSICKQNVCESCWLVGDTGEIQCLVHWEEAN